MKDFNKRIDKEIERFAKKYDLQYEDVENFVKWIVWFTKQEVKKCIKESIELL